MKIRKLFLTALLFGLCSSCFARIMVQQDYEGVGAFLDFSHNCFNKVTPNESEASFSGFGGFSATIGWEFNTDNLDSPIHFYVAGDCGLSMVGFPLLAVGGLNYRLHDFGKVALELDGSLALGPIFGLYGSVDIFEQLSANVLLMKSDRRGLYGGLGVTFMNMPYLAFYKGYGAKFTSYSYAGARFVLGLKI